MIWSILFQVVSLLWHTLRISRLSPDDKTLELLLLRQQLLILRRHQKRGPVISQSEKFILLTLFDRLCQFANFHKAQLDQLILIFKPDTVLRWHRELVRQKWTFSNVSKKPGRPPCSSKKLKRSVKTGQTMCSSSWVIDDDDRQVVQAIRIAFLHPGCFFTTSGIAARLSMKPG